MVTLASYLTLGEWQTENLIAFEGNRKSRSLRVFEKDSCYPFISLVFGSLDFFVPCTFFPDG